MLWATCRASRVGSTEVVRFSNPKGHRSVGEPLGERRVSMDRCAAPELLLRALFQLAHALARHAPCFADLRQRKLVGGGCQDPMFGDETFALVEIADRGGDGGGCELVPALEGVAALRIIVRDERVDEALARRQARRVERD